MSTQPQDPESIYLRRVPDLGRMACSCNALKHYTWVSLMVGTAAAAAGGTYIDVSETLRRVGTHRSYLILGFELFFCLQSITADEKLMFPSLVNVLEDCGEEREEDEGKEREGEKPRVGE